MAKAKVRKLKVYQTQLGFYDTIVAAASKAAALRAWGTRQNLFNDGVAKDATDRRDIDAALAHPDTPLRRGIGTGDPFSLNPNLPRLPNLPKSKAKKTKAAAPTSIGPKTIAKPPPPPDRSALSAAEETRKSLYEQCRREKEELRNRRAMLEGDEKAATRRQKADVSAADETLDRERRAFIEAGGKPDWAD